MKLKSIPTEAQEQTKFIVWLTKRGYRYSASANGGSRNLIEAIKFKRMGVSPGYPDVFVPLPTPVYHGFFVELKRLKGGKVSTLQWEWIKYLKDHGYYAEVARGCDEAIAMFTQYLATFPPAA